MTDSIHEYVLQELEATKGQWNAVAEGSGVSKRTLEKIARREIKDPGISHIEKLITYFAGGKVRRCLRGIARHRNH